MTFKATIVGSCLSSQVFNHLKDRTSLISLYSHLRIDYCNKLLDGEYLGARKSIHDELYNNFKTNLLNEKQQKFLYTRLLCQTTEKTSKLIDSIKNSDFLIYDNNYDLGRKLFTLRYNNTNYQFSNLPLQNSHNVIESSILNIDELKDLTLQFLKNIININKNIQIFFINYPTTAFKKRGLDIDIDRATKANATELFFNDYVTSNTLPDNVTFISCLDLDNSLLTQKGVLYFDETFYQTLAEFIWDKINNPNILHNNFINSFEQINKKSNIVPDPEQNPYSNLPDNRFWKLAVAEPYPLSIKDLYVKKFNIDKSDKIATCGSCFAQHIGKRLKKNGYTFLDTEPAPPNIHPDQIKNLGYGIYSARYGNVYTSRQLLQLLKRSLGHIKYDEVWYNKDGYLVDPFRPNLCGKGYSSESDLFEEQKDHLQKVKEIFTNVSIFVFTMGLTETWQNKHTGAVYPICPGVTAGKFDPNIYEFINLDYTTIFNEMVEFINILQDINPKSKLLLTVSPVPLTATAESRHVLLSTIASKSILRAVADKLYNTYNFIDYFPSYDIIMSPPFKFMFFKNNLRTIHEEGVDFVMSNFFNQHGLHNELNKPSPKQDLLNTSKAAPIEDEEFCDEIFLELEKSEIKQ